MPFPLHALDYGSLCRLRELAAPGEVYNLQIAAPHLDGLQPIQKAYTSHYAELTKTEDNDLTLCFERRGPQDFSGDNFYIISLELTIKRLSLADAQKMAYHLRLHGQYLVIDECQITSSFFDAVSAVTKNCITYLTFGKCTFDSSFTPEYLCTNFPQLKFLSFKKSCPFKRNWIDAFVDAGMADLYDCYFEGATTEMLDVKQEKLVEFLKSKEQHSTLVLDFGDHENEQDIQQQIDRFCAKHFELRDEDSPGKKITFFLNGYKKCYYLLSS